MDCAELAKQLVSHRMAWAFGVPGGGSSLELITELSRLGVQFVTTAHETTAALMAGAISRCCGSPSAAISIKGPGLMNLLPGLLSNAYEGYAMLSLAEAYPDPQKGARRHKWLAHRRQLESLAKACIYAEGNNAVVERGWRLATSEFPGPVHIELASGSDPVTEKRTARSTGTDDLFRGIRSARRPALLLGSVALRASWRAGLASLQIPIFTSVAAKGVLAEDAPFAAGIFTGDGRALTPESRMLPRADLLVGIGLRSGEVLNPDSSAGNWKFLDSLEVLDGAVFPPDARDETSFLSAADFAELFNLLQEKSWGREEIQAARLGLEQAWRKQGWSVATAMQCVTSMLGNAVHVLDTGNFTVVGEHLLCARSEHDVLGTPNGRYMGFGVGYALGVALALPERTVALWIGDGGIRAFMGELHLAAARRLNLLVLVMADGFFGSIRGRAKAKGLNLEPLRVSGGDLLRMSEALGIEPRSAHTVEELEAGVAAMRGKHGPMLIQCSFAPDDYGVLAELLR